MYETLAVSTYVDEAFQGPALQPTSPIERARMLQWISVTNDYLYESIVGCCVAERFIKPMRWQDPDEALIAQALPTIESHLDILDAAVGGSKFFCGAQVSLADFFIAPVLMYFSATPEGEATLPTRAALQRWLDRMKTTERFDEINRIGS